MIYLSGCIRPELSHPMLVAMVTPDMGNRIPEGQWWAMDNACFKDPDGFDFERFERDLRRRMAYAGNRLLFVVTPDVPFDADGTIRRFHEYKDGMRSLGAPVAFVTQDGMGVEDVPWGTVDGVFVGGDTDWKLGNEAAALTTEARTRGQWVHMGRVNSLKRMRRAAEMGCNSVDGTFLKYSPDHNWLRMQKWFSAMGMS